MQNKAKPICKSSRARQIVPPVLVFVVYLTLPPAVHAHKVHLFAWAQGDTVYTESYSGNKKIRGGLIQVFDSHGHKLLEGKTDDEGQFAFKNPKKMDLRIVLEAGTGHRAEHIFKTDETLQAAAGKHATTESNQTHPPSASVSQVDMEQIRVVVEKVFDAKLKPIVRTLAKIQEERGPGLTEIIGGIGYILGVMGLVLYFKSKRER